MRKIKSFNSFEESDAEVSTQLSEVRASPTDTVNTGANNTTLVGDVRYLVNSPNAGENLNPAISVNDFNFLPAKIDNDLAFEVFSQ